MSNPNIKNISNDGLASRLPHTLQQIENPKGKSKSKSKGRSKKSRKSKNPDKPSKLSSPLSTDLIMKLHNQNLDIMRTEKAQKEVEDYESKQMQKEDKLLKAYRVCSSRKLPDKIPNLNSEELKDTLRKEVYNSSVLKGTACILSNMTSPFYFQNEERPMMGILSQADYVTNIKLKHWLRNLKQIGAESVFGVAMSADFMNPTTEGSTEGLFVLKAPRDPDADRELHHELFVGLYGTNYLRKLVPNFAYIYGGLKCSPPYVNINRKVNTWCSNPNNRMNYIIYENISPAISWKDMCQTVTPQRFLGLYLQILYSLKIAQREIDFSHYDLHYNNVLIRKYEDSPISIPYDDIFVESSEGEIATIIDFGHSHIKHKKQNYGVYGILHYFVYPSISYPIHDAYKLLMFSLREMKDSDNFRTFEDLKNIVKFFNWDESIDEIIESQSSLVFSLPFTEESHKLTIDDLIQYIRERHDLNEIVTKEPLGKKLLCSSDINDCKSYGEFFSSFGLDVDKPLDVYNFYLLSNRLEMNELQRGQIPLRVDTSDVFSPRRRSRLMERFDYGTIQRFIESYADNIRIWKEKLSNPLISSLEGVDSHAIFEIKQLEEYMNELDEFSVIYELKTLIELQKEALLYASRVYQDPTKYMEIEEIYEKDYKPMLRYFEENLSYLREDVTYIANLIKIEKEAGRWDFMIKRNPEFRWYSRVFPNIIRSFV